MMNPVDLNIVSGATLTILRIQNTALKQCHVSLYCSVLDKQSDMTNIISLKHLIFGTNVVLHLKSEVRSSKIPSQSFLTETSPYLQLRELGQPRQPRLHNPKWPQCM